MIVPETVNLALDLIVTRVDLVGEGANSAAFIKMYKRKEQETNMPIEEILAKMAPEHAKAIREEIAKAKAEIPEATAEDLAKAKEDAQAAFDENQALKAKLAEADEEMAKSKKSVTPDFEDVIKGLDPAAQEMMRTMKAQRDLAEEEVRKAKADADHAEAVAKAKELDGLPVKQDKLVEIMKSASTEVVDVLKAVHTALKDGKIFEEFGKNRGDGNPADSQQAWVQMEKHAKDIAVEEGITKEKAMGVVMKKYPDLYRQYLDGGAN